MSGRAATGAMPEDHDAIRIQTADDEPPAVVFNDQAPPRALVSWAWCQLAALDALLQATTDGRQDGDGGADVVGAVRSVLGPALNALAFSERRAHELQHGRASAPAKRRRRKHAARK